MSNTTKAPRATKKGDSLKSIVFVVRTQKGKTIECPFIDPKLQKSYDDFHSIACDILEDPNNKSKLSQSFGTQDRLLVGKETKASAKAGWNPKVIASSKLYYALNTLVNSLEEFKPFLATK